MTLSKRLQIAALPLALVGFAAGNAHARGHDLVVTIDNDLIKPSWSDSTTDGANFYLLRFGEAGHVTFQEELFADRVKEAWFFHTRHDKTYEIDLKHCFRPQFADDQCEPTWTTLDVSPPYNLLSNGDFEVGSLDGWESEGDGLKGVDVGQGWAREGNNNAWIHVSSGWNAIRQVIWLPTNHPFRLTSATDTSSNFLTGFTGARDVWNGNSLIAERQFGAHEDGRFSVDFRTPWSNVALMPVSIYVGMWASEDSWMRIDDVYVADADANGTF